MKRSYIHGYSEQEQQRLISQGAILANYVFENLDFRGCEQVLEVGSGVGAQTTIMLKDNPNLQITGLEIEDKQIQKANLFLATQPHAEGRYQLVQGNILDQNVDLIRKYDAVVFIWVLEHISQPMVALRNVQNFVNQGGKVFAVEVFHSSLHLYPHCPHVMEYWHKGIAYQKSIHGDADIGHRLGNIFHDIGLQDIQTKVCPLHFGKNEANQRGKMLNYWHGLMKSAFQNMKTAGFVSNELWEKAEKEILDLKNNDEAVFYYAFVSVEGRVDNSRET